MTELATILGSITGLGSLGALVALFLAYRGAKDGQLADRDARHAAERLSDGYHTERDLALEHARQLEAELTTTTTRLIRDDGQRNDALTKEAQDAHDAIATGVDPGGELDGVLAPDVSNVPDGAHAAAGGDGASGGASVQPPAAASGVRAGSNHGG